LPFQFGPGLFGVSEPLQKSDAHLDLVAARNLTAIQKASGQEDGKTLGNRKKRDEEPQ
jgi:hypothetical protein